MNESARVRANTGLVPIFPNISVTRTGSDNNAFSMTSEIRTQYSTQIRFLHHDDQYYLLPHVQNNIISIVNDATLEQVIRETDLEHERFNAESYKMLIIFNGGIDPSLVSSLPYGAVLDRDQRNEGDRIGV